MDRSVEQRYAIKFCVKLGKSATETFPLIQQAFGSDCLSKSQVLRWHKSFKEGREEVADELRSGRPSISRIDENVTRVRDCLNSDRRLSLQMIAETLNMTKTTIYRVETSPRQRAKPQRLRCQRFPGQDPYPIASPASLQSWPGSPRLFFVSSLKRRHERETLGHDRKY